MLCKKRLIRKIRNIILENYTDPNFHVQKLADMVNISTSYLRDIFYAEFKTCPQKVIESLRLKEALKLITTNNTHLYKVSELCGYSNARSFRKAFVNLFSITPSEFKKHYASQENKEKYLNYHFKKLNNTFWLK